jgi:hypothetical protein
MKKLVITLIILSFFGCKTQQVIDESLYGNESAIIGTWVTEESTLQNKWVFTDDELLKRYDSGHLFKTYIWSLVNSVNSGVRSQYLELINIKDSSDVYNYEISILDEERLTIIYQRKNNMGLGKPTTLFKQ